LLLLLFFLFTALCARYCTFKIVFSYSAIQPQVCLIFNKLSSSSTRYLVCRAKPFHYGIDWCGLYADCSDQS